MCCVCVCVQLVLCLPVILPLLPSAPRALPQPSVFILHIIYPYINALPSHCCCNIDLSAVRVCGLRYAGPHFLAGSSMPSTSLTPNPLNKSLSNTFSHTH